MTTLLRIRKFLASRTVLASVAGLALLSACETSPTGRRQLQLIPSGQLTQMGDAAYAQIRKEEPALDRSQPISRYIECVADAVTAAVGAPQGGGQWSVTVFRGDQVNAFVLPGGHIGVYTGLLKAATTPAELAAVIGHEVAHMQAEHPNARISAQYAADTGLSLVQALSRGSGLESQQAMALLGLGAQVGLLLPFSRSQETEADILGLRYMASAGFDPRAAIDLWQNMARVGGAGAGGPVFLSTHPSGAQRMETLQTHMPQALATYRQSPGRPRCMAVAP